MVQDPAAGGVPTGMRGVVVGLGMRSIDVIWDNGFMGGSTLQGKCSPYRGSTVPFSSCLNLTRPQFTVSERAGPKPVPQNVFRPQLGPRPAVPMQHYQPSVPGRQQTAITTPHILHKPKTVHSVQSTTVAGNNGHLKYSGVAKGVRPQPIQQQPVSHRDQLSNLLGGLRLGTGPVVNDSGGSGHITQAQAQGNLPVVYSHASAHQSVSTHPPIQGKTPNMNNKPSLSAARGRGAANGAPFSHRGAHNGVPAFAHGGAPNGAPRGRGGRGGGHRGRGRGRGNGGSSAAIQE